MMYDITFANQNQFTNFGRGKDKVKRKSRVSVAAGAGLGTVAGGPVGTIAGGLIARGINKEKDRYEKEGPRSHLGKIGHDAKLGAKSVGIGSAITAGLAGAALGSKLPTTKKKGFLGLGRDKKAEARQKLKNTLIGAGLGVLGGGVSGAVSGASNGALVGAGRGFLQENKTKKKKGKFSNANKLAEFALSLPPKKQKQRSRLGMVGHDTAKGAKIGGAIGAAYAGGSGIRGVMKAPGSLKSKLGSAALVGTVGALRGGAVGGLGGASTGVQVGAVRALVTPRKKKSMFDRFKK
jgi:hypothetical protein